MTTLQIDGFPGTDPATRLHHRASLTRHGVRAYRSLLRPRPVRPEQPNPLQAFVLSHPFVQQLIADRFPDATSLVHVAQEVLIDRPLVPGAQYDVEPWIRGVRPDRDGAQVLLGCRLLDAEGTQVAQLTASVRLGGVLEAASGDPSGLRPRIAPAGTAEPLIRRAVIEHAFVRRYAEVAGDDNPIHLEVSAAHAAGFHGPIAHGMSMVAMAVELATERYLGGDPGRLTGVGVRFSAPVLVGSDVTWTLQPTTTAGLLSFTARTTGAANLKAGWLTYREPVS